MYFFAPRATAARSFATAGGAGSCRPRCSRRSRTPTRAGATAGIFVSRFLPGLRAAVPPFAGVVGLPPLRGARARRRSRPLIWYAFLAAAGYQLAANWEGVKALVASTNRVLGIVAIVVTAAAAVWLWRRSRRAARSSGPPPP